jgi:predicted nucleic acid-binding protein
MKLSDALQGIRRLAFDSAPLIYFVERHPVYFDRMLFIMRHINAGPIEGVASTIALTEVLVQPLRVGNDPLAQRYEAVLSKSRGFRLEPTSNSVARRAADLRARYALRTPDALHVATAIEAGYDGFLTNDASIKRVAEIRVLVLDDLELDPPAETSPA